MENLAEKLMPLAMAAVISLYIQHPLTWRIELAKLQYSILKEVSGTRSWGNPSIFRHVSAKTSQPSHKAGN